MKALLCLILVSLTLILGEKSVDDVKINEQKPRNGASRSLQDGSKTSSPTSKRTITPTSKLCIIPDRFEYNCGEPITFNFDYSRHSPSEAAKRTDRIGIYPCYIKSFKKAEVWQWSCGGTPKTCKARSTGSVKFDKLPSYNRGGQFWPLAPNYNKERKFVNRCYKAVILRDGKEPYTPYCESDQFFVYETSAPNCSIRIESPTD
jgi:hypothetical protein